MKKPSAVAEHRRASKVIHQARKRAKLTQLQLAVRAGLDPSTIAQAERPHGVASFETKLKLAKVLGLEPMDLFKRTA